MEDDDDLPAADMATDETRPDAAEEAFEQGSRGRALTRREEASLRRAVRSRAQAIAERDAERAERMKLEAELAKLRAGQTDADVDRAEAEYRDAVAEGDEERIAKANRRMAEAAANAKAARIVAEQEAARQAQPPRPSVDPAVEDWVESNSHWFKPAPDGRHDAKTRFALIVDQEAREVEGLRVNSPAYFAYIEKRVEERFPGTIRGTEAEDEPEPQPAPRRAATGAAPVSGRSAAAARPAAGVRPQSIRLTQEQLDMAKTLGMSPEKYAARVQQIGASGFKDPGFMGLKTR